MRVERMTAQGHEDAFPRPRLSACCPFSQGTFAGPRATGETRRKRPLTRNRARHERRLLGVGSSAWFGVQGGNRVQRAALLPSGCFSLYASYFPVE
jgi:hypothetical protein